MRLNLFPDLINKVPLMLMTFPDTVGTHKSFFVTDYKYGYLMHLKIQKIRFEIMVFVISNLNFYSYLILLSLILSFSKK